MYEPIEWYTQRYGEPLIRFETGASGDDRVFGDVPDECAVFKINHPSQCMAVCRYGYTWHCNSGVRAVIWELLKRFEHKCTWQWDDEGYWETECGNKYVILEGTPKENGMKYCTYCGREINEQRE